MDAAAITGLSFDTGALRRGSPQARLQKAAHELEAVCIQQVLKEGQPKGGLLGASFASQTFQDMLNQVLAEAMAQKSVFGLADAMMKQAAPTLTDSSAPGASSPIGAAAGAEREGANP